MLALFVSPKPKRIDLANPVGAPPGESPLTHNQCRSEPGLFSRKTGNRAAAFSSRKRSNAAATSAGATPDSKRSANAPTCSNVSCPASEASSGVMARHVPYICETYFLAFLLHTEVGIARDGRVPRLVSPFHSSSSPNSPPISRIDVTPFATNAGRALALK